MSNIISKLENWFFQKTVQQRLVYLSFVGVLFAVFALNYFFPLYADDMMYSVVKFQEPVSLGDNLREIGEFIHYYYFNWGGRAIAHIVAHLLLLFGPISQAVINSFVFILLLYVTYKITLNEAKSNFFLCLFLGISLFYFTPSFLSSAIWKTGSANYLWTATFSLAFFLPFYRLANDKQYSDSVVRIILFFILGAIIGWSNENTAPTLFLLVASMLGVVWFYKKKQIPYWAIAGLIGVAIGCCLMILSPGNAVRAEAEGYASLFNSFDLMYERLQHNISGAYRHFMLRPIFIFVVCLVLHHFFAKDELRKKDTVIYASIFFILANISMWLTIVARSFPPRAFMIITVLTLVSIGVLYANIDLRKMLPKLINIAFLAWLIFYASIDYMTYLKGTYFLHKEMTKREAKIKKSLEEGKTAVMFEAISMDYRFEYTDFANYYKDYYKIEATFVDKIEEFENE